MPRIIPALTSGRYHPRELVIMKAPGVACKGLRMRHTVGEIGLLRSGGFFSNRSKLETSMPRAARLRIAFILLILKKRGENIYFTMHIHLHLLAREKACTGRRFVCGKYLRDLCFAFFKSRSIMRGD